MSRILGFLRDCLIAASYGTSATAQAFVVAFRIPNLLRDLAGEGAANSAFVPVFSRTRALEGRDSWRALAQAVWSQLLIGLLAVSVVGIAAAPWLVTLVAPGFRGDPELLHLTIRLTRILFPFIGLIGMAAFFMGLLNSVDHFTLPSLGPVILNLSMIAGLFLWRPDALGLAWGVIAGGVAQLAVQAPALSRAGVRLRLRFQWGARDSHPGVRQIRQLLIPRTIGTGVYQISVLVDTIFASFRSLVGSGGIAVLYFAHRFLHLPMALFGISMAQAALPAMTRQAAAGDMEAIRKTCLMALRSSLFIAVPASVGLIFLGRPIIQTLLERGAFSPESTRVTVATLQGYALGLASMCAVKVLANTLYAFHDTWTPVRSAAVALAANVLLNSILVFPMKLPGLALATSISSTLNGIHLAVAVRRRIGSMLKEIAGWLCRVVAASVGMGIFSGSVWMLGERGVGFSGFWGALGWLLLSIGSGAGFFLLLGLLLEIEEARGLAGWLRRKLPLFRRD
ncbi:MAG: murein biosynthesis integral membrane protein MurJ [Candidatus Omnitrophica bacterium]|nr:murein biosynthesis integral membrane protein MurJ [Candidatus Omnitrophota bacterium]